METCHLTCSVVVMLRCFYSSICRRLLQVSGRGTFQVRITTLRRNHRTTTATTTSTELLNNGTVPTPVCRTFVRYCLTNYQQLQPTVPFSGNCEYAEVTSPMWTGCSLLYPNNSTVSMPFTFTWPVCNVTNTQKSHNVRLLPPETHKHTRECTTEY